MWLLEKGYCFTSSIMMCFLTLLLIFGPCEPADSTDSSDRNGTRDRNQDCTIGSHKLVDIEINIQYLNYDLNHRNLYFHY